MEDKICPICKTSKPFEQWVKNSKTKDGLSSYCKDCTAQKKKKDRLSRKGYYRNESVKINESLKNRVLEQYAKEKIKCNKCGYDNQKALTVDLIDRSHKNSGTTLWKYLVRNKFPSGFEVICMNCREIKRHDEKIHECINTRCQIIARPT